MSIDTEPTEAVDVDPTATGVTPGPVDGGDPAAAVVLDDDADEEFERPTGRLAVAVAFPVIASAIMVGGVFTGPAARIYAVVTGLLGIGLAVTVARMRRRAALGTLLIMAGLFGIGLLAVVPSGLGNIPQVRDLAGEAAKSRDVLRPPVALNPGWQAIIGWLMGIVGFVSAWVAVMLKKPSIGLLLPLPIAAIAGISVPDSQQVASGIVVLVLFAIGLGVLSSETAMGEDGETPPIGYEIRKALKALPLLIVIVVALVVLARANILFPAPRIDPAQEPQKPKTVPLTEVEDRVLFEVKSKLSGPWRIGNLDEYDGKDWRLPPFAQNELVNVPKSGIVDKDLEQEVRATFTVRGLGGAVLATLPNTVGVAAKGPKLAFDARSGNIRLVAGQVEPGLVYTVAAAGLPSVDDLKAIAGEAPKEVQRFAKIGDPPPAVVDLLNQARAKGPSDWEHFDFLRTWVLDNVTAT
ncbi:MAG TPA: transglutaminaseTgpA domain-containing protein, partial [Acidimicrobiales bacterium]|nr:transglutaminaseTgpA domain-containing protein [Acidimicrobiales bacterium]